MKNLIYFFAFINVCIGQTYTQPTLGVNGTYAGACLVNTCSGTFYDNGGAGGNYAANINSVYRTFCPNTAGNCVRATFTSFSMNDTYFLCFGPGSCCDYLTIYNGAGPNTPVLYNNCTASPGTVTASSANGCLSFMHTTDGSVQLGGWAATISCVPCAGGPAAGTRQDCIGALQVCNDAPIAFNSVGPGLVSESCSGCSSAEGEIHSSWYVFQVANSGTLGLTIQPAIPADDFDFVLYGPGATCGALGAPVRCSYAATGGNTGMGNGAVDVSEIVTGDGWVSPLPVTAGQIYYLQVNHWNPPTAGYTLDWNLTGGATLNCTPLSAEVTNFECNLEDGKINVSWSTAAESHSDYFKVEKSNDGINFRELARTQAQGNSDLQTDYYIIDANPDFGDNYYRLTEVDLDGEQTSYEPTYCRSDLSEKEIVEIKIFDLNGHCILTETEKTNDTKTLISQLQLKSGMYILQTKDIDNNYKLIKFVQIQN